MRHEPQERQEQMKYIEYIVVYRNGTIGVTATDPGDWGMRLCPARWPDTNRLGNIPTVPVGPSQSQGAYLPRPNPESGFGWDGWR